MDERVPLASNVGSTRYIIFSACGYGNVGDDAIMLGTARYLITRQNATDLFIFSYSPKVFNFAKDNDLPCIDISEP